MVQPDLSLQTTTENCADVTWCGKLLQTQEAATGKARSPYVDSLSRFPFTV